MELLAVEFKADTAAKQAADAGSARKEQQKSVRLCALGSLCPTTRSSSSQQHLPWNSRQDIGARATGDLPI